MTWRAITKLDLADYISGSELEAYAEVALAEGQTDAVVSLMAAQMVAARKYLGRYEPGPDGTVPDGIIPEVCQIMVPLVITRTGKKPSEERTKNAADAKDALKGIAQGDLTIAETLTALEQAKADQEMEEAEPTNTAVAWTTRPPRTTQTNMNGL